MPNNWKMPLTGRLAKTFNLCRLLVATFVLTPSEISVGAADLHGIVLDPDGKPATGVTVRLITSELAVPAPFDRHRHCLCQRRISDAAAW